MNDGFTENDKVGVDGGDQPEQKKLPKKEKTYLESLADNDILGPWIQAGMFPQKYTIDKATGLITDSEWTYPDPNLPWIMVNNDGTRECDFYKDVDRLYDFIPPPCRCCWKVVAVPTTLKELLQLLEIEIKMVKEDPYCYCKCGIELRHEVERNYGGYFYCNDLNQGLVRLQQVRELVHKNIGPHVKVILKRGCTEFERKYGPSDKWDDLRTPEQDATWQRIISVFKTSKQFSKQPELVQRHIIMIWVDYAASIGDPSIPLLNNGQRIYPGYITYEMPTEENENAR